MFLLFAFVLSLALFSLFSSSFSPDYLPLFLLFPFSSPTLPLLFPYCSPTLPLLFCSSSSTLPPLLLLFPYSSPALSLLFLYSSPALPYSSVLSPYSSPSLLFPFLSLFPYSPPTLPYSPPAHPPPILAPCRTPVLPPHSANHLKSLNTKILCFISGAAGSSGGGTYQSTGKAPRGGGGVQYSPSMKREVTKKVYFSHYEISVVGRYTQKTCACRPQKFLAYRAAGLKHYARSNHKPLTESITLTPPTPRLWGCTRPLSDSRVSHAKEHSVSKGVMQCRAVFGRRRVAFVFTRLESRTRRGGAGGVVYFVYIGFDT